MKNAWNPPQKLTNCNIYNKKVRLTFHFYFKFCINCDNKVAMFVTCSIQSLKFCRSHHYVQRGLRLLQLLRLLHLLRLLCLLHFLRLQSLLATLATGACYTCYSCYVFFDCYTYSLSRCIFKSHEDLNQTWKFCFLQNRDRRNL